MTALLADERVAPDRLLGWQEVGGHPLSRHLAWCGPRPLGGPWLLDTLERSGLRGRGGAWVSAALKWRSMIAAATTRPVVVINGSEGEPLSAKDRTLLATRPHLVLDGAMLAAETVGASDVVVYVARHGRASIVALRRAVAERRRAFAHERPVRIVQTAHRYVAGESSAVVNRLNGGPSKPLFSPPHPSQRGVDGRPTLVHNVETLAHVGLIARHGADWFRQCGTDASPGTALMTVSGGVRSPGVYEVDLGGDLASVIARAGGASSDVAGALLGGYFGTWISAAELWRLPLDPAALREHRGASLGCGVLAVLPVEGCAVAEAARIATYMAGEGAGQCGPCVFGLRALAAAMTRIAASAASRHDVERVTALMTSVRRRGACRHPDGAVENAHSALITFAEHVRTAHLTGTPCPGSVRSVIPPPPRASSRWR